MRRLRNHHPNPTPIELARHGEPLEWLSHVNVSVLKVKLAKAMIGISAIHLLKAFIEAGVMGGLPLCRTWQTIIHSVYIL